MADFGVTQFFFDPNDYLLMVDELAALGCDTPVLPGIMPFTNLGGLISAWRACPGPSSRAELVERLEAAGDDAGRRCVDIGVEVGHRAVPSTCSPPASPGLHLYTLNRSTPPTRGDLAPTSASPDGRRADGSAAGSLRPPMAEKITAAADGTLQVSDEPIIPFIEGDGTGVDIWPAAQLVLDAAAAKHGKTIAWKEVLAGEKAFNETGDWLPEETVDAFQDHLIGIKGPLTTPVGGGIRCSTWPCARSSTSTSACARCAGSRACPRR